MYAVNKVSFKCFVCWYEILLVFWEDISVGSLHVIIICISSICAVSFQYLWYRCGYEGSVICSYVFCDCYLRLEVIVLCRENFQQSTHKKVNHKYLLYRNCLPLHEQTVTCEQKVLSTRSCGKTWNASFKNVWSTCDVWRIIDLYNSIWMTHLCIISVSYNCKIC